MLFRLLILVIFFGIYGCNNLKPIDTINKEINIPFADSINNYWLHKNPKMDSIAGISLERAFHFLKKIKSEKIVIALIDSEIKTENVSFKNKIWINKDEIPNNKIDDDNNGYVDDVNGWNFLNTKLGGDYLYMNYDFVRYIRKFNRFFFGKNMNQISKDSIHLYKEYIKANKYLEEFKTGNNNQLNRYKRLLTKLKKTEKILSTKFPNLDIRNSKVLDSLTYIITDSLIKKDIDYQKVLNKYGVDQGYYLKKIKGLEYSLNKLLNTEYDERFSIGDNVEDINDLNYGNNNIQGTGSADHATRVTSLIVSDDKNFLGIADNVEIMPLNILSYGNEFDKDIALSIKYAVDNGAKIINMSFGKEFSIQPEWIKESILYAEKNDVLLITSSGNESDDLDIVNNYPNDSYNNLKEFAANLIKVGSTSYNLDSTLVSNFSNYGKNEVDIFAPGEKLFTLHNDKIKLDSGTSLSSALTTGVAALIRSHYPNLTAMEVKNIILKSGISLDIMVYKPSDIDEKQLVPFNSLSKSGKILNAYNAILLADKISRKKK